MKVGFYGGAFLPVHLGHLNCIVEASCQVDKLYVVVSHSKNADQRATNNSKIRYISGLERIRWMKQLTIDIENVEVIDVEDDSTCKEAYNWKQGADNIKEKIPYDIDVVFSSEPHYDRYFSEYYPTSEHVLIDPDRCKAPISSSIIRGDGVFKHWDFIPNVLKQYFVKKIVVFGIESTGKSTLMKNLAKIYNTEVLTETGRDICDSAGGVDTMIEEDFRQITYLHKVKENEKLKVANKLLFIDTEALITQYYTKLLLGIPLPEIDSIIDTECYDLCIYLEPDIPFVQDGTRISNDELFRHKCNNILKNMLFEKNIKYESISGDYYNRFCNSKILVDKLLQ